MIAVSKKTRIITRSGYSSWFHRGKENAIMRPRAVAASLCRGAEAKRCRQIAPSGSASPKMPVSSDRWQRVRQRRKTKFADRGYLIERKTPPSGRPGQVKALDGVSPQPQDRQRSACALQVIVVEVLTSRADDAPLNAWRRADGVG
jgi:hypothetical protein